MVELSLYHTTKKYGGVEAQLHVSPALTPRKSHWCQLDRRLCGPRSLDTVTKRKSHCPLLGIL